MFIARTAMMTKIEPMMSAPVILRWKIRTEPIVADNGSKASIRLKVVASMYFKALLASWNGIRVPIISTPSQQNQTTGRLGTRG